MSSQPADIGGTLKTVTRLCAALISTCLLSSCITDSRTYTQYAPLPPSYGQPPDLQGDSYATAEALNAIRPAMDATDSYSDADAALQHRVRERAALNASCDLKDRFDRDATLSYRFEDGRSQLGFKLNADPTQMEFHGAKISFRYKLQEPGKKERVNCLYESPVQGLVGSAFHEMFDRKTDNIWDKLDDRGF